MKEQCKKKINKKQQYCKSNREKRKLNDKYTLFHQKITINCVTKMQFSKSIL